MITELGDKRRHNRKLRHQLNFKPSKFAFHGLPTGILFDPKLEPVDKMILMVIYPLTVEKGYFHGSNELIANRLNRSEKTIQKSLRKMERLSYIYRENKWSLDRQIFLSVWLRNYFEWCFGKKKLSDFEELDKEELEMTIDKYDRPYITERRA